MTAAVTPEELAESDLAEDAEAWERGMRAVTLRNAGASWAKLAETFGVSVPTIKDNVRRVMLEVVRIPAEEMVTRQRSILLDLTRVNYQAAMAGNAQAQAQLMRILEHEAKLFGLYAPTRVTVGISESEFAAQAAELLAALGTEPLRALAGDAAPVLDAEVIPDTTPPARDPEPAEDWSNV